ncbi:MAG: hypothetical protein DBX47_07030 [Clostridiales bacterium]|nr:MAG: hypothetical protein DBX47_07030 [Clostridiales bacterium]
MPYFFGWILVFVWIYCCFLSGGNPLYFNNGSSEVVEKVINYIWLAVGPIIAVVFKGTQYVPKTVFSAFAAFICLIILVFFNSGEITGYVLQIIISAAIGHIFVSCGYGFFIILNNAEKFYSMIIAVFLPKLLLVVFPVFADDFKLISFKSFILMVCLAGMLVCASFFCREQSDIPDLKKTSFPKPGLSLMGIVFLIYAFCDVIAPAVVYQIKLSGYNTLELWYFASIVAGLLLVVLLQKKFKLNICIMLNITTAMLALGFVLSIVSEMYSIAAYLCAVCFGIAYGIGMVNIYYFAGFITKKFQSLTFYRAGIIFSAAYYFFGFGTIRLFENALPVISIISVCVMILFFVLSPLFVKLLYSGDWIDDSYREDVTFESRLRARLHELKLSPKETEVCELLLCGYTLRQTAAMLNLAYPTVNTYCTSLYRKLGINSRTELTLLFKDYIEN